MHDTVWNGAVQKLVDDKGIPNGMKTILEERGVDATGMRAKEMRDLLKTYSEQKPLLEEYIERRGHIFKFYPKFHCELSPIERVWCHSKKQKAYSGLCRWCHYTVTQDCTRRAGYLTVEQIN